MVEVRMPSAAAGLSDVAAEGIGGPGFTLDTGYLPVPVPPGEGAAAGRAEPVVVVRGTIEEGQEAALRSDPRVVAVWSDARIAPFAHPCGTPDCNSRPLGPTGDLAAMARYLGADRVWEAGERGEGIEIAILDTGVRRRAVPALVDGWSPPGTSPWGDDGAQEHGTMCAVDALEVCPDAGILDLGIMKSAAPTTEGFLSDAVAAYDWPSSASGAAGRPRSSPTAGASTVRAGARTTPATPRTPSPARRWRRSRPACWWSSRPATAAATASSRRWTAPTTWARAAASGAPTATPRSSRSARRTSRTSGSATAARGRPRSTPASRTSARRATSRASRGTTRAPRPPVRWPPACWACCARPTRRCARPRRRRS